MRGLVLSLAVLLGACGTSSKGDYCARRQAAWERAFPDDPQTEEQRRLFVESCREVTASEPATERERRVACLEKHIRGTGDPLEEYQAMTTCEGGGPRPVD